MRLWICYGLPWVMLCVVPVRSFGSAVAEAQDPPRPKLESFSRNPIVFSPIPVDAESGNCGAARCGFVAAGRHFAARIGPGGYSILPANGTKSQGLSIGWSQDTRISVSLARSSGSEVVYRDILPGIGLRYYDSAGNLEFDFVVEALADPSLLRFSASETSEIRLLPSGDLWIAREETGVIQRRPVAFQLVRGVRRAVSAAYAITGPTSFSIKVGEYDSALPLVIDPIVEHASTFGNGTSQAAPYALAKAPDGTIVYLGRSDPNESDPPLPGEPESRQHLVTPLNYSTHLTRFSPDLKQAIRSVFLGFVNSNSQAHSLLAVGPDGSIVVVQGYQDPAEEFIPPPPITTGPFGATTPLPPSYGPLRGSVLKVSEDLETVTYATVFRCTGDLIIEAITIAPNNDLVLAGRTACLDFPVTPGAYQRPAVSGQSRLFLARLNPTGTQLTYATLFGGSGSQEVKAVSLNSAGDYVVAGTTSSIDFPITAGTIRGLVSGEDGFVSVVSADGGSLLASTAIGGADVDILRKAGLTADGDIVLALQTYSDDLPTTMNAFRKTRGYGFGALARISPDLRSLRYLSYLPGMLPLEDLALDAAGNAWLSGGAAAREEGYAGTVAPPLLEPWDNFSTGILKISADGASLLFGTSWFGWGSPPLLTAADENGVSVFGFPLWPESFPKTDAPISTARPGFEDHNVTLARIDLADPTACALTLPVADITMSHHGGPGSFQVQAPAGCPWIVLDNYGKHILESDTVAGLGDGTIPFQLEENESSLNDFLYQLTINGRPLKIRQLAFPCSDWSLSSTNLVFPAAGGVQIVTAKVPAGCTLWHRPGALWLSTSLPESPYVASGTTQVSVTVPPNSFAARSAAIQIMDREILVTQAGGTCTANVSSTATAVPASGGELTFQISTSEGSCAWNAQGSSAAISFPEGASGTGSSTLRVRVSANPASQTRGLTVSIAGQPRTITQAAGECSVLSVGNWVDVLQAGGRVTVPFQSSGSACVGVLQSDASWIFPETETTGSSSLFGFYALPNTTGQTRRTTVQMLGHAVTVQQFAGPATELVVNSEPMVVYQLNGDQRTFNQPVFVETDAPFTIEVPEFQVLPNDLLAAFHGWGTYGAERRITITPQDETLWLSPDFSYHLPFYVLYQGNPSVDGGSVEQVSGPSPIYTAGNLRYYAGGSQVTFTAHDGPNARFVKYSGLVNTTERTITVPTNTGLALSAVFEALGPDPGAPTLGALVEGAGFRQMPVSPGSIAALFGTNLCASTVDAPSLPLPQQLGGCGVLLRVGGIGYTAWLFYVSPRQINLFVPEAVPAGPGTIELVRDSAVRATLPIEIAPAAPSLFAANSDGKGAPAGYAIRVSGDHQIRTDLYDCPNAIGSCVPALVDFGSDSDELFLTLYGTGFRGVPGKPLVSIGGVPVEVDFAGPHGVFAGLDQINVKVPRSLRGLGELEIQMWHGGVETNPLRVKF